MLQRLSGLALSCALSACASAPSVYGHTARYSPAFHGYVMAQKDGSDDPSPEQPVLLLRNPLTGDKLRCRDEVVRWRELHEDLAEDLIADENAAVAALATTTALFAPLVAVYPVGALVLAEAELTAESLYADLGSADGHELLARGVALYRRTRYVQAIPILERALAKDASVGVWDEAFLYLGLAYQQTGQTDRALLALGAFVDRSGVRDVDAYRTAEAALTELGELRPVCSSTDPVELHW